MSVCSLTVIFPTRNNEDVIVGHLQSAREWIDLADQIIVVDSSEDRTPDLCLEYLPDGVELLRRPPGLYAAWNDAIDKARCKYTYISTVGDTISREGLLALLAFAEEQNLDMAVSPPQFVGDADGLDRAKWPIHVLIDEFGIDSRLVFDSSDLHVLTIYCLGRFNICSLSGSFASNITATNTLKMMPFPSEFGGCGDSVWFSEMCTRLRFGIFPECMSTLWLHECIHENHNSAVWERACKKNREVLGREYSQIRIVRNLPEQVRQYEETCTELRKVRKESKNSIVTHPHRAIPLSILKKYRRLRLNYTYKVIRKIVEEIIERSRVS